MPSPSSSSEHVAVLSACIGVERHRSRRLPGTASPFSPEPVRRRPPHCSPPSPQAISGHATTAVRRGFVRSFERGVARAKWLAVADFRRVTVRAAAFGVAGDEPPATADVAYLGSTPGSLPVGPLAPVGRVDQSTLLIGQPQWLTGGPHRYIN